METTKQLTEAQKKAIDIVQNLVKENKIDINDAFQLFIAIYETEKEYVYVPYTPCTEPWVNPWTTTPGYPGSTPIITWYNNSTSTNKTPTTDK